MSQHASQRFVLSDRALAAMPVPLSMRDVLSKHARPRPLQRGELVDVADACGRWLAARVMDRRGDRVFVHYEDFSFRWDEWIDLSNQPFRFADFGTLCVLGVQADYKPGDHVNVYSHVPSFAWRNGIVESFWAAGYAQSFRRWFHYKSDCIKKQLPCNLLTRLLADYEPTLQTPGTRWALPFRRSDLQRAAIKMYTGNSIYAQLNADMREYLHSDAKTAKLLQRWAGYIKQLLLALHALPDHCGTVYRGVAMKPEFYEGTIIEWTSFSSASTVEDVANNFAYMNALPLADLFFPKLVLTVLFGVVAIGLFAVLDWLGFFFLPSLFLLLRSLWASLDSARGQRPVVFVIESRTGKNVQAFSQYPGEREVILLPHTKYRVERIEDGSCWLGGPTTVRVYLQEMHDRCSRA